MNSIILLISYNIDNDISSLSHLIQTLDTERDVHTMCSKRVVNFDTFFFLSARANAMSFFTSCQP